MVGRAFLVVTPAILVFAAERIPAETGTFPVAIQVHADRPIGEWKPIWRFFGADEPNYACLPDGREIARRTWAHWQTNEVYFRDPQPADQRRWHTGVEVGFDRRLHRGCSKAIRFTTGRFWTGFLTLTATTASGLMWKSVSCRKRCPPSRNRISIIGRPRQSTTKSYTGWAYPPKDYAKWSELVFQWAKHDVERYGRAEVRNWYWETWNEANIGYWQGTPEEFFRLHDEAVDAVRRALPEAKVGGPDSAGGGTKFLQEFLEHCLRGTNYATGKIGTPLDFVSFHAKGSPIFTDGHVCMGIANQLRDINSAFGIIASFPELKSTPIIIGESDPDGCAACQSEQFGYRNHPVYASYTAECIAREFELAGKYGVNLEAALTWAFEFEDQPPFAGFRSLASDGIDLPVLNVFRMFSQMGGQQLAAESDHSASLDSILKGGVRTQPDVSALASLASNRLCVLVWHYHDDDTPGPAADIKLTLDGLPAKIVKAQIRRFRIDTDHSDAFTVWQHMGSPMQPTPQQFAELEKAGQLAELEPSKKIHFRNGQGVLHITLPREAVSLLVVEWRMP